MTAPKIRADYEALGDIGGRFSRAADENQIALRALERRKTELQNGEWIGVGARAFYAEMDAAVLPAMLRVVGALRSAADSVYRIRAQFQQAEADASVVLRRMPEGLGIVLSPTPSPKPAPPADAQTRPPKADPPLPEHGFTTPVPFPIGFGISQFLSGMVQYGPKALRSAAKTTLPILSVGMNALKYRAADADGSFDWSRFLIATGKDLVFNVAKVPLAAAYDAGLGLTGLGSGAMVGIGAGVVGVVPGAAAGAAEGLVVGAPLAGLAATITLMGVDMVLGDRIVDGLDDLYQQRVRPYLFPGVSGKSQSPITTPTPTMTPAPSLAPIPAP